MGVSDPNRTQNASEAARHPFASGLLGRLDSFSTRARKTIRPAPGKMRRKHLKDVEAGGRMRCFLTESHAPFLQQSWKRTRKLFNRMTVFQNPLFTLLIVRQRVFGTVHSLDLYQQTGGSQRASSAGYDSTGGFWRKAVSA